jgi:hypothetical protein
VVAVSVLASAVGVAGASTHASRFANAPAARSSKDAGTNAPPMPLGGPGGVGGDVKAVTGSSITIVSSDGTASTYALNSATTVTDIRQSATPARLSLGESVHIVVSSVDSTVAGSITIVPANIAGRVGAISGDTISLAGPNGDVGTIQVNTATTYSRSGESASLSDVSVGSFVFAGGTFGSLPTTIDAATVGIGMPGPGHGSRPNSGSGPMAGPFARGPPGILGESRYDERSRNKLTIA